MDRCGFPRGTCTKIKKNGLRNILANPVQIVWVNFWLLYLSCPLFNHHISFVLFRSVSSLLPHTWLRWVTTIKGLLLTGAKTQPSRLCPSIPASMGLMFTHLKPIPKEEIITHHRAIITNVHLFFYCDPTKYLDILRSNTNVTVLFSIN